MKLKKKNTQKLMSQVPQGMHVLIATSYGQENYTCLSVGNGWKKTRMYNGEEPEY